MREVLARALAREAARAISGPRGGRGAYQHYAEIVGALRAPITIHIGLRMILEVSWIGSLEIGVVQVWILRFQALEGALRKPCAVIFG